MSRGRRKVEGRCYVFRHGRLLGTNIRYELNDRHVQACQGSRGASASNDGVPQKLNVIRSDLGQESVRWESCFKERRSLKPAFTTTAPRHYTTPSQLWLYITSVNNQLSSLIPRNTSKCQPQRSLERLQTPLSIDLKIPRLPGMCRRRATSFLLKSSQKPPRPLRSSIV